VIVLIEFYLAWFFLGRFFMSAVPGLRFLDFFDEFFLLVAMFFVHQHRTFFEGLRKFRVVLAVLLMIFGASFALNLSSPGNLALILSSYAKPLLFGAVLYILFGQAEESYPRLRNVFVAWCLIQLPFLAWQFIAAGASMEAVDDMVGTFGVNGSLELGYLAGLLGCIAVPGIFATDRRSGWIALFLASLVVALVTNTRQVVLLVLVVGAIYFLVFRSRSSRAITVFVLVAAGVALGAYEVMRLDMFSSDYELAVSAISDLESTRKVEGILTSASIFESHPQYYFIGAGPGMYTSHVALNAETEYARTVNYSYYLQMPGGEEEGLGGTMNQSSSSFLSVVGEVGFLGYIGCMALLWLTYVLLKSVGAAVFAREVAFTMAVFITFAMFLQNILEGGVAINVFWAVNALLLSRVQGLRSAAI
jgi:hypothetical protein